MPKTDTLYCVYPQTLKQLVPSIPLDLVPQPNIV